MLRATLSVSPRPTAMSWPPDATRPISGDLGEDLDVLDAGPLDHDFAVDGDRLAGGLEELGAGEDEDGAALCDEDAGEGGPGGEVDDNAPADGGAAVGEHFDLAVVGRRDFDRLS